jgi:2-polyprenyl-3-methyl-5-hydroxy-6-metoxy-1,4-benzoquinol methylase
MNTQYFSCIGKCRLCGGGDFQEIYRAASVPVAGIYYDENEDPKNVAAPITLLFCNSCGLFQLKETINPDIYHDYNFAGSQNPSYDSHLRKLADKLVNEYGIANGRVFEVGASDGALLKHLAEIGKNEVMGIEPSEKLRSLAEISGTRVIHGYFNSKFVESSSIGTFDCVIIRHVIEHIDDLADMIFSLRRILNDNGLLVVETPDVDKMIQNQLFSNIFHEHLNYFSVSSISKLLSKGGFEIAENMEIDIH